MSTRIVSIKALNFVNQPFVSPKGLHYDVIHRIRLATGTSTPTTFPRSLIWSHSLEVGRIGISVCCVSLFFIRSNNKPKKKSEINQKTNETD